MSLLIIWCYPLSLYNTEITTGFKSEFGQMNLPQKIARLWNRVDFCPTWYTCPYSSWSRNSNVYVSLSTKQMILIIEPWIKGYHDPFNLPDNESTNIRVRHRQTPINSNQLLEFGIKVLPVSSIAFKSTLNRSLTASLSFPDNDPLFRLLDPLMYVTSNKCPTVSLYPSK